jgi:hypothetical protein
MLITNFLCINKTTVGYIDSSKNATKSALLVFQGILLIRSLESSIHNKARREYGAAYVVLRSEIEGHQLVEPPPGRVKSKLPHLL